MVLLRRLTACWYWGGGVFPKREVPAFMAAAEGALRGGVSEDFGKKKVEGEIQLETAFFLKFAATQKLWRVCLLPWHLFAR